MLTIGKAIPVNNFSFAGGDGFTIAAHSYLYSIDINKDGIKELISAGFETQPNTPANFTPTQVNIFGWINGSLVNISDQWLPNKTNIFDGVADIVSGDFNGDGLTDIYLSGDADMTYQLNSYVLINQGDSFKKISLGLTQWEHGVTSGDVNGDGYTDVIVAGYLHPSPIYLGGSNGLTKIDVKDSAQNLSWDLNASGVAFGDFLGNGSRSLIVVDGGSRNGGTNLFKINSSDSNLTIDYVSTLPEPLMGAASHDVRARTMDFNHDGLDDVIVFSRESWNGTEWRVNSRIQFYLNKGNGVFDDVTSTTLIGYDTHSNASYNPIIADFNDDGLLDIFISDASFGTPSNSTAILLQQANGTFVDSYRKELSALVNSQGGLATITKGPDNFWYLVSEYQIKGGDTSLTMYKLVFNNHPTGSVTISGTTAQNKTLTASNTLADADGLGTISYQWFCDGTAITNAIQSNYKLTQADVGKKISVKASYVDGFGTAESVSSNNIITGGAGNDDIHGGTGINTSLYSGAKSNYTITNTSTGFIIQDNVGTDGTDTLTNIQRLQFSDTSIAYDMNGNAGTAAKILGAVFGKISISNESYVGLGLQYLDAGTSYQDLMQLALNAKLGAEVNDPTKVVTLLYTHVMGVAPDKATSDYFVGLINSHQYSAASLGVMAADTSLNATNIDLVGLAQAGIHYVI